MFTAAHTGSLIHPARLDKFVLHRGVVSGQFVTHGVSDEQELGPLRTP